MIKRRVEIFTFERERVIKKPAQMACPICQQISDFLTARQASRLAQVTPKSIYRWLTSGNAHGVRTAGGGIRVCRASLFRLMDSEVEPSQALAHRREGKDDSRPNVYFLS